MDRFICFGPRRYFSFFVGIVYDPTSTLFETFIRKDNFEVLVDDRKCPINMERQSQLRARSNVVFQNTIKNNEREKDFDLESTDDYNCDLSALLTILEDKPFKHFQQNILDKQNIQT